LSRIERRIASGATRRELAAELFARPDDGAIKLYLTWTVLDHRRELAPLYARGAYRPLEAEGALKAHLLAFGRLHEGGSSLAIVPRLAARLMGEDGATAPVGEATWKDTRVILPDAAPRRWRELLTDSVIGTPASDGQPTLAVGEVLSTIPV